MLRAVGSCCVALSALLLTACDAPLSPPAAPHAADRIAAPATLDDLMRQVNLTQTVRGGGVRHVWSEDGRALYFSEYNPEEPAIWRLDLENGDRRNLPETSAHGAPLGGLSLYSGFEKPSDRKYYIEGDDGVFVLDTEIGALIPLSAVEAEKVRSGRPKPYGKQFPQTPGAVFVEAASPDGALFASVRNNELYMRNAADDGRFVTAQTPDAAIWNDYSFRWSPDSRRMAVVLDDHSASPRLPIIDWLSDDYAVVDKAFYPTAGSAFPQGSVHIVDAVAGRVETTLSTGARDHYIRLHQFSSDSQSLYYFVVSRTGKRLEYWRAAAGAGSKTLLVEEEADWPLVYPYAFSVAPNAAPIRHLPDGRGLLWLSERSGERNLYHYSKAGAEAIQLTDGLGRVHSIAGYDEKTNVVYLLVQSDARRPYDTHLFSVALSNGEAAQLTQGAGRRAVQFSPDYRYFIETVSTPTSPTRVLLKDAEDFSEQATLSEARFDDWSLWTAPEEIQATAADGKTALHGLLYKPPGFEPGRKYPLLEYIYAGPQAVWAPKTFLQGGHYPRAMAKAGYLVLVVDGRGTPERGPDFQRYAYGRLGQVEIADHAAVIEQLAAERPYIDQARIGVFGTSFGGYYAVRAMLDAPHLFAAGVSSAPAIMERAHVFTPVEAFMGLPGDNPEGYAALSFAPQADQLSGPLLILTGASDANTPLGHALEYMEIFLNVDKPVRMVVMPGRNHHFMTRDDVGRSPYWILSIREFFDDVFMDGKAAE